MALGAVAVVIATVTGAWSRVPAARGWAKVTVTVTFGLAPPEATLPTEATTPGVTRPVGKVMATVSPALTSDCCAAASARQAGTWPYSNTTGVPLFTRYKTLPWPITRPGPGSQVIVPPPWPVTV